jgi:shikimate dehydrogenase
MQEAAFRAAGLDWEYRLVRVPRDGLERAWPELARSFVGLNVTSPHKGAAARLADSLSPAAQLCASVNTLTFGPEGAFGDSTDGAGFLAALRRHAGRLPKVAVVLGAGGAARAVALALSTQGSEVRIVGRNRPAGARLAQDLTRGGSGEVTFWGHRDQDLGLALSGAGLLVNATTLGGSETSDRSPVSDSVSLDLDLTVFDLVYWPRRTALLRRAVSAGCRVVEGLDMLVEQGARSFESWTGTAAPLEVMREAADRELEARS